MGPTGD
jgi:hypothetical protein